MTDFPSTPFLDNFFKFVQPGVSDAHNIFCWWNHKSKEAFFNQEVGCWWGRGQETLGKSSWPMTTSKNFIVLLQFDLDWMDFFLFVCLQGKFQAFYKVAICFNSDDFDYDALERSDYVFMRWKVSLKLYLFIYLPPVVNFALWICLLCFPHPKEQFLVPDHTIKDISGASFAGFYYICFQKSTATIEGYYYHRSSEWSVINENNKQLGWMASIISKVKQAQVPELRFEPRTVKLCVHLCNI